MGKRGQVTIFVIIGIVIVVLGVLLYSFRDTIVTDTVSGEAAPVKTRFMDCVENSVELGVSLLESNAGYIENPEFKSGSRYQPFSSSLTFSGTEVPYWYYLSASGLAKEQVPTVEDMQNQMENFIAQKVMQCDFEEMEESGFDIEMEQGDVSVDISSNYVDVDLSTQLSVEREDFSAILNEHNLRYNTELGLLYERAVNLYELNREDLFLVDYGVDVLRLNMPVDGVELTCSPMVWNVDDLFSDLKNALEINYAALNNRGESNDYFNVDFSRDVDLSFIYSSEWPTYFEVNPADRNILISEPIGNQEGMGILGFCYVPYHFVYDLRYPMMVRVEGESETFQFPVVLEINKNVKGEPNVVEAEEAVGQDLCEFANTEMSVSLYNSDLEKVDGSVSYQCFDSLCELGQTESGELTGMFPQCVNGVLKVRADGYKNAEVVYSTVDSGEMVVILDREYQRDVRLELDGQAYSGSAVITFLGEDKTSTAVLPDQENVVLSQGEYEISVMAYDNGSITFPETQREECYEVPRSGLLGVAGLTEEECVTVDVPSQELSNVLIGGGSVVHTFSQSDLENSRSILIEAEGLENPETLEELQENYVIVEGNQLGVSTI